MSKVENAVKWIAKAAINGLAEVMRSICEREFSLSPDELKELDALVRRDLRHTVAAKVSAVEEQPLTDYQEMVGSVIDNASWTDLKRIIHAVNLRVARLPTDQVKEITAMLIGEKIVAELGLEFRADEVHFTSATAN